MSKIYIIVILIWSCLTAQSQSAPPLETVGNPTTETSVASYTGWSNQGVVTYMGNAAVQNTNPSNSPYASGAGNVFFTNTPGIYFQISGLPGATYHDGIEISFDLFGYDTANLNELSLSVSENNGLTWSALSYKRLWGSLFAPTPWDHFFASLGSNAVNVDVTKLMFKFIQTTSTKTFRIDDIRLTYYVLLPIKLTSFSAIVNNGVTVLNWQATSTSGNEAFVVERSNDGVQFSTVAQQSAKGNGEYAYTCNDTFNSSTKTFYRLKMINADGTFSYSKTVVVNSALANKKIIQSVYPIPAKDVIHVTVNNDTGKKIILSVVDVKGSKRIQRSLSNGITNYTLNIQHLEPGIYYLIAEGLQNREYQKIIITK